MGKWWRAFEERFGGGPGGGNRINTLRWLIIVAGVGAIFMILNSYLKIEKLPQTYENEPRTEADANANASLSADVPAFRGGEEPESPFAAYEAAYEKELKDILQRIVGVGEVSVMVTIDSTEEIVVERNMTESSQETNERDSNGVSRRIVQTSRSGEIVIYSESGDNRPIVRKMIKPSLRGVVVVAEGAENAAVKKLIIEAVERGLGVAPHKISVVPSKR